MVVFSVSLWIAKAGVQYVKELCSLHCTLSLSISLILVPQLSGYPHRLTPCYFQAVSLLYGASLLSAVCLLCKQCSET